MQEENTKSRVAEAFETKDRTNEQKSTFTIPLYVRYARIYESYLVFLILFSVLGM